MTSTLMHHRLNATLTIRHQSTALSTLSALALATPEKIEDIFVALRTNLVRIIQNWEKSGQGDGGSNERSQCSDDDDADDEAASGPGIGGLQRRSARALDNRAAFLYGKPSYILYFWELADQHQLLQSSLQQLDRAVDASDASNAPIIHLTRRQRRGHVDDNSSSPQEVGQRDADEALVRPLVDSFNSMTDRQREMHEAFLRSQCNERIFRRKVHLQDEARKVRRLNAELKPDDPRFESLSAFYATEGLVIEREISALDNESATSSH